MIWMIQMLDWKTELAEEKEKDYYKELMRFIEEEYESKTIYPPKEDIEKALALTPLESVKAVIVGQDPYHEPNKATGLAFSVNKSQKIPDSLRNIFKELNFELGCAIPNNGDLTYWAKQGVLLLNSVLTVQKDTAGSHKGKGWETYTDAIIKIVNKQDRPVFFMLWGKDAKQKKKLLNNPKQKFLTAAHPSPRSAHRGFFGCGCFKTCNEFLSDHSVSPIDWQISDI